MNKRILLVDDDEGILDAFKEMLESENYAVDTSCDGEVLLHLEDQELPNLIILDVLLSGRDGRILCRYLKDRPATQKIPIIMISAHPTAEQDMPFCGANDFLKKPFEMDNMLKKVAKHLSM